MSAARSLLQVGWSRALLLTFVLHVLLCLGLLLAWQRSPEHDIAASNPVSLQASLDVSNAESRVAQQALHQANAASPAQTSSASPPLPQPLPEPKPQEALTPIQQDAQQRVAQSDHLDQDKASDFAQSQEKAKQEQEEKQRQEQIDLTETRKKQELAEQKLRLAQQQQAAEAEAKKQAEQQAQQQAAEAEAKKQAEQQAQQQAAEAEAKKQAEQQAAEKKRDQERQQKIEQIRQERAKTEREASLARQRLRQLDAAKAAEGTVAIAPNGDSGQHTENNELDGKYQQILENAIQQQWVQPASIPVGQRCTVRIHQLPGGQVIDAQVMPDCPYDDVGKRSIEAAVRNAQPLPYQGFESVFRPELILNFEAQ